MRRFVQTFVLAPQTPKKYYVHNDIFRYQVRLQGYMYYAKYYGKGGGWPTEEKRKLGVRGKNEKGKEKRRKITLKTGKEALKMYLLGL